MTASFIKEGPYLPQDRVINLSLPDLVVCSLCRGILWLPIACQNCETPFCLSCIKNWQIETSEPTRCPKYCVQYNRRTCPPSNLYILNTLQVVCRYRVNGCKETLSYNSLETHEEACGYRLLTCSGCEKQIAKQDFNDHHNTCPLVSLTCHECNTVYRRQDEENHTEIICLRVQLHQLRDQMKKNEQMWHDKFIELQRQINNLPGNIAKMDISTVNIVNQID